MRYVVKRRRKGCGSMPWWIYDTKHKEYVVGSSTRTKAEEIADEWELEEQNAEEDEASGFNAGLAALNAAKVRELFALRGLRLVGA